VSFQFRMGIWNVGMIKVSRRSALHSQLLHNGLGWEVIRRGECNDFGFAEGLERVLQPCRRCFRCVAIAPEFGMQAPADFCNWSKRGFKSGFCNAAKTQKFVCLAKNDRPETVTKSCRIFDNIREIFPHFFGRMNTREILHNSGFTPQSDKCLYVIIAPIAQDQAWCIQDQWFSHILIPQNLICDILAYIKVRSDRHD